MDLEQYEKLAPYIALKTEDGQRLVFHTPNRVALWRAKSLYSKEPFTVNWLEGMQEGAILLDVGANVGMYSLYAAVVKGVRVYAFEPESQNYALLNKNIHANQLSSRVTAYCCALSDEVGLNRLFLSKFETGGSCHSLGAEVGFDLKPRSSPYVQGCLSWTIDQAVTSGAIQVPRYIKIDVDGFEHKVIAGARETLRNPAVKELLIEVNPHLPEHRAMVHELTALGFHHDRMQALMAGRHEGPFSGVGEWIFKRYAAEERGFRFPHQPFAEAEASAEHIEAWEHTLQRITQTPVETAPFPHLVVDGVFPPGYYARIAELYPTDDEMQPLSETGRVSGQRYQERLCLLFEPDSIDRLDEPRRMFWSELGRQLFSPAFLMGVLEKFFPLINDRLEAWSRDGSTQVLGDALVVSDRTRYSIGPHTDAPHRLLTFLFY